MLFTHDCQTPIAKSPCFAIASSWLRASIASSSRDCPGPADSRAGTTTLQQRLGVLLVRAGHRLQGLNTVTRQSLDTVATGERTAIA